MQFITVQPLVDRFREGTFKETEIGPYFMAFSVLSALFYLFTLVEHESWEVYSGVISIFITIFGVLHLKKKNQNSYGNHFLAKVLCLGWVIGIRMLLILILLVISLGVLEAFLGELSAITWCILSFIAEVTFYWWLGKLIAKTNEPLPLRDKVLPPIES